MGLSIPQDTSNASSSKPGSSNLAALGRIVPDRDAFRRDMLAVLPAQLSTQPLASSSQADGLIQASPGSAPSMPLLAPSGLSRPQFLVATQAASLPFFPAFNQGQGGVVLDRMLLGVGGDNWWGTMTGRLRAQRLLKSQHSKGWRAALQDPANYALASHTSMRLQGGALLRTRITYEPQQAPSTTVSRPPPAPTSGLGVYGIEGTSSMQPVPSGDEWPPGKAHASLGPLPLPSWLHGAVDHMRHVSGTAQLRRALGSSTELRLETHANAPMLLPPGPRALLPSTSPKDPVIQQVPFLGSFEIGTTPHHTTPLQYKVGVQHLVLPSASGAPGTEDGSAVPMTTTTSTTPGRIQTKLHAGLALQGQRTLWKGSVAHRRAANTRRQAAARRAILAMSHGTVPGSGGEAGGDKPGGERQEAHPRGKVLGPHNPIRQVLQKLLRPQSQDAPGPSDTRNGGRSRGGAGKRRGEDGSGGGKGGDKGGLLDGLFPPLPQPEEVQEAVLDATQSIKRLREDVQNLVEWVSSGGLENTLQQTLGTGRTGTPTRGGPSRTSARNPAKNTSTSATDKQPAWSALVGPPHIALAGLMGVGLHQSLWPTPQSGKAASTPPNASGVPHDTMPRANSLSVDLVRSSVAWLSSAWSGGGGGAGSGGGAGEIGDTGALRHGARLFASVGVSAQAGWFQRMVLDYTRVTARLDVGLPGTAPGRNSAGSSSSIVRALTAPWSGASWNALTLSLSQQLIGPIRLCADLRYALEPSPVRSLTPAPLALPQTPIMDLNRPPRVIPGVAQSKIISGVTILGARARQAMSDGVVGASKALRAQRPRLVDACVALDTTLPGSSGFVRVVAWYAPMKGEAMVEIRLL